MGGLEQKSVDDLMHDALDAGIIGAGKPSQLEDNLKAVEAKLSAEDLKSLARSRSPARRTALFSRGAGVHPAITTTAAGPPGARRSHP